VTFPQASLFALLLACAPEALPELLWVATMTLSDVVHNAAVAVL